MLRDLYEADQADRRPDTPPPDVIGRDRARRRRVAELLEAGEVRTGEDLFHAAMIFQHGDLLEDYQRARELALRSAELGYRPGSWLAAAALDRWLVHQGRPQKYGTQYKVGGSVWELSPVDPATTDAERSEWDVPPLDEARRRAAEMSMRSPPRESDAPRDLRPLVTHRAGDLEVQVCAMGEGGSGEWPPPAPLQPGDPVPWLPPGLSAVRLGPGFGAADQSGEAAVVWLRAGTPVIVRWREEDGQPPKPETVEVGGRAAILCRAMDEWSVVVIDRPGEKSWMVASKGSRHPLLKIAASLPS